MSKKPHKRTRTRRRERSPDEAVDVVALSLFNTYRVERSRFMRIRHLADKPISFSDDFGQLTAARERSVVESPEVTEAVTQATRRQNTWRKLAEKLIARRIDPQKFIRRQFMGIGLGGFVPMPAELLSEEAMRRYENGNLSICDDLKVALRVGIETFEVKVLTESENRFLGLTVQQAWARVLDDLDVPLSALFRYCLAVAIARDARTEDRELFRRIAQRFEDAAASQFIFSADDYVAAWGKIIPEDFPDRAEALYADRYGFVASEA